MLTKTLIAGAGNPLRHDDGIGPEIIRRLREHNDFNCNLLDIGTDGLALLDEMQKYTHVILIDAVNMSNAPGTVKVFTPEEAKIHISSDTMSTHGFGLAEVIKLMTELNIQVKLTIIGIQPENIAFGDGLSFKITAKIPELIGLILESYHQQI